MRRLGVISSVVCGLLAAMAPVSAGARTTPTTPLLIGTYTGGTSQGIYLYAFDSRNGHIDPDPVQVTKAENPSWLTVSGDRRFVYAVNENGPGQRDSLGRVSAYRLDETTGQLTFINRVLSLGSEPTHASLSADGRFLFVSNYSVLADPGGTLAVLPVASDGSLGAVTQIKTHRPSFANPERQSSAHVHSVVSSPDGRYVFSQDLGADRIYAYRYDPTRAEAPLLPLREQPFVELPAGSGPRHLVFAPNGHQAYLTLEMAGQVAVFDYADGRLKLRQTVALADPDFKGKVGAAALHFSPDGRFLYVTDRGTDNQLVTFSVSADNGDLTLVDRRSVEGLEPREFAIDPTGRFLLVANQHSGEVVVFRRDTHSGKVGKAVETLPVDQAADITFIP